MVCRAWRVSWHVVEGVWVATLYSPSKVGACVETRMSCASSASSSYAALAPSAAVTARSQRTHPGSRSEWRSRVPSSAACDGFVCAARIYSTVSPATTTSTEHRTLRRSRDSGEVVRVIRKRRIPQVFADRRKGTAGDVGGPAREGLWRFVRPSNGAAQVRRIYYREGGSHLASAESLHDRSAMRSSTQVWEADPPRRRRRGTKSAGQFGCPLDDPALSMRHNMKAERNASLERHQRDRSSACPMLQRLRKAKPNWVPSLGRDLA